MISVYFRDVYWVAFSFVGSWTLHWPNNWFKWQWNVTKAVGCSYCPTQSLSSNSYFLWTNYLYCFLSCHELFEEGQVAVEVPHSARIINCHDCGTLGRRRCWSCFGNGEVYLKYRNQIHDKSLTRFMRGRFVAVLATVQVSHLGVRILRQNPSQRHHWGVCAFSVLEQVVAAVLYVLVLDNFHVKLVWLADGSSSHCVSP